METEEAKERLLSMKNQLDECVKRNAEIDDSGIDDNISTAIETVLKALEDYKKENEELKSRKIEPILINNKMYFIDRKIYEALLTDIKENYISKQKVIDKIEEVSNDLEIMKADLMYGRYEEYGSKLSFEKRFSYKYGMHDVLQDLLKEE